MANETVVQQLPGSVPNERILVCLRQTERQWGIRLRQQHWAEGIGWYDQKVLQFDARQWSALRGMLSTPMAALPEVIDDSPETIPFPGPTQRDSQVRKAADQA
jgi:hypothetical protein